MQRLVSVHAAFYVLVSVHAAFMFWFRCMHPPITCTSPPPPSTDRAGMTHACGKVGGRTALDAHKQYTAPLAPPPMAAHLTASEVVLRDWAVAAFSGPDEQHSCEQLSLVATVTARPGVCAAGQGQTWCVCIRGGVTGRGPVCAWKAGGGLWQGASVCVEGGAQARHQISGQPSSDIRSVGSLHQTSDQWAALIRHQISGQPSSDIRSVGSPQPAPTPTHPNSLHPPCPYLPTPPSPHSLPPPPPSAYPRPWPAAVPGAPSSGTTPTACCAGGGLCVCVCVLNMCVLRWCVCVCCVLCVEHVWVALVGVCVRPTRHT